MFSITQQVLAKIRPMADIKSIRAFAKELAKKSPHTEHELRVVLRQISDIMAEHWFDYFVNEPANVLLNEGKRRKRKKAQRS